MDGHEISLAEMEDRKFTVEPSEEYNIVVQPELQLDDVKPPMPFTECKQELNPCSCTESENVSLSQLSFELSSSDTGDIHSKDNAVSSVSLTNDTTQDLVQPGCQLEDVKPSISLTEFKKELNPCSSTESVSDNDSRFSQIPLSKETGGTGTCIDPMYHSNSEQRIPIGPTDQVNVEEDNEEGVKIMDDQISEIMSGERVLKVIVKRIDSSSYDDDTGRPTNCEEQDMENDIAEQVNVEEDNEKGVKTMNDQISGIMSGKRVLKVIVKRIDSSSYDDTGRPTNCEEQDMENDFAS